MGRMYRLQRLNTGFFIGTNEMYTLRLQVFGLMIQLTERPDLLPKLGFVFYRMVQSVSGAMGFEIAFF